MSFLKYLKVPRKTFFNPAAWIGYEQLKEQNISLFSFLKSIFIPARPNREETFAEAMLRLELSEADLITSFTNFKRYAVVFVVIALMTFLYGFFLLFRYHAFIAFFLALAATGLFLSQAFKYDFWALQIKERRLGLNFDDWKRNFLGEKVN